MNYSWFSQQIVHGVVAHRYNTRAMAKERALALAMAKYHNSQFIAEQIVNQYNRVKKTSNDEFANDESGRSCNVRPETNTSTNMNLISKNSQTVFHLMQNPASDSEEEKETN